MNITDVTAGITQLVPGTHPIDDTHKTTAAGMMLPKYSKYRAKSLIEDFTGDGTQLYDVFSSMTAWSEGFSDIVSVEYPVDDDDLPVYLDPDSDYMIQGFPAGNKLRFITDTPAATESFRVTYTGLRDYADIPAVDEEAVICLAASYFADMLSTWYAQSGDGTINADSVDQKSKSQEYAARAKVLRTCFFSSVGITEGKPKPVCASVDWDLPEVRLTNPVD